LTNRNTSGMPKTRPPDANQWQLTSARINAIGKLNSASHYLEVGVFRGETFRAVDCDHRCGVDPNPQFDVSSVRDLQTEFHVCTSDAFFTAANDRVFDTIFLDGLHTFEQTLRDFINSLSCAHARTVWLIDDTWPSDLASALPSLAQVGKFRSLTGDRSNHWHGDVFKLVFALHDFFPMFDWRTIIDQGNPQTILVRDPRAGFKPRWNNLAAISGLGYADFVQGHELLQPCTEAEAMEWLKRILTSEIDNARATQSIEAGEGALVKHMVEYRQLKLDHNAIQRRDLSATTEMLTSAFALLDQQAASNDPSRKYPNPDEYKAMAAEIRGALEQLPENAEFLDTLGDWLMRRRCWMAAVPVWEARLATSSATPPMSVVLSLLSVYRRLGRETEAAALAKTHAPEIVGRYGAEIADALQRGRAALPNATPGIHLIDGPPGTGKSTLGDLLSAFGFETVDGDKELARFVHKKTGEVAWIKVLEPNTAEYFDLIENHEWVWNVQKLKNILSSCQSDVLFVFGTAANFNEMEDLFDSHRLLVVPPEVLKKRVQAREPLRFEDGAPVLLGALKNAEWLLSADTQSTIRSDQPFYEVLCDIVRVAKSSSTGVVALTPPPKTQTLKFFSNSGKTSHQQESPMNQNINAICSSIHSLHAVWRDIEGNYPHNYQNLSQSKAQVMLRALKFTLGQRVLEMGCNSGLYTLIMSNYASSVDAIDIDGPNIQRAKAGFDFAQSNGWCADNINFECSGIIEFINDRADFDCFVASLVLYYLKDDEVVKLRDYIRKNINRIIVQCRPARKKLVENNPQYGLVSYTSLYNGLYDISDNLNFLHDCGFKDVLVYGMGEIENDACPVLIADKNGLFE